MLQADRNMTVMRRSTQCKHGNIKLEKLKNSKYTLKSAMIHFLCSMYVACCAFSEISFETSMTRYKRHKEIISETVFCTALFKHILLPVHVQGMYF